MIQKIKSKIYKILRWSEKYAKTDMVYVARGGTWLTLNQIVASATSFILSIAFANFLSKETYGTYKYLLSLSGILGALTLTGMNTAVSRAVAKGLDGSLKQSFRVQMKWGFLSLFAALIASGYYYANDNHQLALAIILIGILSPIFNSANTYVAFLNGKRNFKSFFWFSSSSTVFLATAIFISMIFFPDAIFLIFVFFLINTLTNLFFYFRTLKLFVTNTKSDDETITYGKHLSLMNFILIISQNIDRVLVFHFLGAANLAIYYFATAVPDQLRGFLKIIGVMSLPKITSGDTKEIRKTIFLKAAKLALMMSMIIALYLVFAPFAYRLVFPQYLLSVPFSQVFSINLLFVAASTLLLSYLQAQKKIDSLYKYNIVSSLFQIGLVIILVKYYGLWGVVYARLFSSVANLALVGLEVKKTKVFSPST